MEEAIEPGTQQALKAAMDALGNRTVLIDGTEMPACKCYYFSLNPLHVLFNDNCPELLKESIRSIFNHYQVPLPLANS